MKMTKKLIAFMLVFVMILALGACGAKEDPAPASKDTDTAGTEETKETEKKEETEKTAETEKAAETEKTSEGLKVGFSLPSLNFPFYVRMYDTIVEESEKRGWELSFVDGNLDAGTQMNGLQDLINQDIDVLVMATWWIDAMADIFAQCEEAGIPVFLMDNMGIPDVSKNAITFTTGTDNYNAGFVGGTWAAEYLKSINKTDLNLILVYKTQEMPMKRGYGFRDGLIEGGINVNVLHEYDAGEREKAMTATEDALTTYDNIDLIFGTSAQDALGAYDACAGANRKEIIVFGFDGEDEELQLVDGDTNYLATVTQDPVGMARLVAENVEVHVIQGQDIEQAMETPAGVYGPEGQMSGEDILGK